MKKIFLMLLLLSTTTVAQAQTNGQLIDILSTLAETPHYEIMQVASDCGLVKVRDNPLGAVYEEYREHFETFDDISFVSADGHSVRYQCIGVDETCWNWDEWKVQLTFDSYEEFISTFARADFFEYKQIGAGTVILHKKTQVLPLGEQEYVAGYICAKAKFRPSSIKSDDTFAYSVQVTISSPEEYYE